MFIRFFSYTSRTIMLIVKTNYIPAEVTNTPFSLRKRNYAVSHVIWIPECRISCDLDIVYGKNIGHVLLINCTSKTFF